MLLLLFAGMQVTWCLYWTETLWVSVGAWSFNFAWSKGVAISACLWDCTHKRKDSLYFGDQLLFLDLVVNLRFLSLIWGPIIVTSTKGRNIPVVCHFRSFTARTRGKATPSAKAVDKEHSNFPVCSLKIKQSSKTTWMFSRYFVTFA